MWCGDVWLDRSDEVNDVAALGPNQLVQRESIKLVAMVLTKLEHCHSTPHPQCSPVSFSSCNTVSDSSNCPATIHEATGCYTCSQAQEEAETVTGHTDPEAAARAMLARPGARTEWCVVKMGGAGALLACKSSGTVHRSQGIKVWDVCGVQLFDSVAARAADQVARMQSLKQLLALLWSGTLGVGPCTCSVYHDSWPMLYWGSIA